MAASLTEIVIDCNDPRKVGEFWSAVLDWPLGGNEFCLLARRIN